MKTIIAGSRKFTNLEQLAAAMERVPFAVTTVINGMAKGADTLGGEWARRNKISVIEKPANWSLGTRAGFLRNEEMANEGEALVLFWDYASPGTRDMLKRAEKRKLPTIVFRIEEYVEGYELKMRWTGGMTCSNCS